MCTGTHVAAILGTNQSLLEAVLLKRRVVGPAWLALSKPVRVDAARQVDSSASCGLACDIAAQGLGHTS